MLIKNIYPYFMWPERLLHCVENFWQKSLYPVQGYTKLNLLTKISKHLFG